MELFENEGCDIPAAGFLKHNSKITSDRNLDGGPYCFSFFLAYLILCDTKSPLCSLFISTPRRHPLRAHTQEHIPSVRWCNMDTCDLAFPQAGLSWKFCGFFGFPQTFLV